MASQILERSRAELAIRRSAFAEVFKHHNFRCAPGAPYGWLELPEHWTAARFTQSLAARKVRVTPGMAFDLNPTNNARHIRVCFGHPRALWQTRKAFDTIAELMVERDEEDFTPVA